MMVKSYEQFAKVKSYCVESWNFNEDTEESLELWFENNMTNFSRNGMERYTSTFDELGYDDDPNLKGIKMEFFQFDPAANTEDKKYWKAHFSKYNEYGIESARLVFMGNAQHLNS